MKSRANQRRHAADKLHHMVERGEDRTDWARVDAASDEAIEAATDHEEEGQIDWLHAQAALPQPKQQLTIRFDMDVIDFFKAQGKGYQTRMNAVLKRFVEANRQ